MTFTAPELPESLQDKLSEMPRVQVGSSFNRATWKKWLADLDGVTLDLDALPERITRADLVRMVNEAVAEARIVDAFVVTMIWGYGPSGRGASRTRTILTGGDPHSAREKPVDPDVAARLTESVKLIRSENGLEAGYRYLNNKDHGKIAKLGPAFFTKWLYAVSAKLDPASRDAGAVLDKRVLAWLNENTSLGLKPGSTSDYLRYMDTLRAWSALAKAPHTPVQVEQAIFELTETEK